MDVHFKFRISMYQIFMLYFRNLLLSIPFAMHSFWYANVISNIPHNLLNDKKRLSSTNVTASIFFLLNLYHAKFVIEISFKRRVKGGNLRNWHFLLEYLVILRTKKNSLLHHGNCRKGRIVSIFFHCVLSAFCRRGTKLQLLFYVQKSAVNFLY